MFLLTAGGGSVRSTIQGVPYDLTISRRDL